MSIDLVNDISPRRQYIAAAGQTVFAYPFPIFANTDLVVIVNGVTKALSTNYTVSGATSNTGGNVTFLAPMVGNEVVTIYRDIAVQRLTDFQQNGPWTATAINDELDRMTLVDQQLKANLARCLRIPVTANVLDSDASLDPSTWANKYLTFDVNCKPTPAALATTAMTQPVLAGLLNPRTQAEITAGVVPVNLLYLSGDVRRYGAVGDGVADDTGAVQNALNASPRVTFPAGLTFKITARLTVPTSCYRIEGLGANINGPGSGGAVDGFYFTGFYQGAGSIILTDVSRRYHLPAIKNCRYGIHLQAASWVFIDCDLIQSCISGVRCDSTAANLQYVVECDINVEDIDRCTNGFEMISYVGSGNGIQGCHFKSNYISGCNHAIGGTFDTALAIFTFNYFDITVIDGAGVSGTADTVNFNLIVTNSANFYRIPGNVINMTATPTPYINVGLNSRFEVLYFSGGDVSYFAMPGFLPVQPVTACFPASGTMTVNVATTGSDATGNGSATAPYLTVQKALNMIQALDVLGQNAVIALANGTYTGAVSYDTTTGYNPRAQVFIRSASGVAANVTLTGGINVFGATAKLIVQNLTLTTVGIAAQYGAAVQISNLVFGTMAGGVHMQAQTGASIAVNGNYSITGGAAVHAQSTYGGSFVCNGTRTVTLTGTPAFTSYFAYSAFGGSNMDWATTVFSGTATGQRYAAVLNGVINTAAGGATFLPGSVAGAVATGGQYA